MVSYKYHMVNLEDSLRAICADEVGSERWLGLEDRTMLLATSKSGTLWLSRDFKSPVKPLLVNWLPCSVLNTSGWPFLRAFSSVSTQKSWSIVLPHAGCTNP